MEVKYLFLSILIVVIVPIGLHIYSVIKKIRAIRRSNFPVKATFVEIVEKERDDYTWPMGKYTYYYKGQQYFTEVEIYDEMYGYTFRELFDKIRSAIKREPYIRAKKVQQTRTLLIDPEDPGVCLKDSEPKMEIIGNVADLVLTIVSVSAILGFLGYIGHLSRWW